MQGMRANVSICTQCAKVKHSLVTVVAAHPSFVEDGGFDFYSNIVHRPSSIAYRPSSPYHLSSAHECRQYYVRFVTPQSSPRADCVSRRSP